jgi:hypothetical protein
MSDKRYTLAFGEKQFPRSPRGPVSAGWCSGGCAFRPADGDPDAIVFTRIWDEAYLYPAGDVRANPLKLTEGLGDCRAITAADWNHDGVEDFVLSSRNGFLFLFEQVLTPDGIRLVQREILRDCRTGHVFNIEFLHPVLGRLDSLGGYVSLAFHNYLYPAHYPGAGGAVNLVVGDSAGRLWWLPDESGGRGAPRYSGRTYRKDDALVITQAGRALIKTYGDHYATPADSLADEAGAPFVLGDFFQNGITYPGGNVKPIVIRNPRSGLLDLLVAAGVRSYSLHYLQCVAADPGGKPVFRYGGAVTPVGLPEQVFCYHIAHALCEKTGTLAISVDSHRVFRCDLAWKDGRPVFGRAEAVEGDNVQATGYQADFVVTDPATGGRYVSDFPNKLRFRRLSGTGPVFIDHPGIELTSGGAPVRPLGETDPQMLETWGFHRSALWRFDGSLRNHVILGTDTGNLRLVIDEGNCFTTGECRLTGYLRDRDGEEIKLHNRAAVAAFDLDGDGREDLIVGGQTYQRGIGTDPAPGSGFRVYLNRGVDAAGLPVLEKAELVIEGYAFPSGINAHMHLAAADIDGDGEPEVIISVQQDGPRGRIMKKVPGKCALYYTGNDIPRFSIHDGLMDIDGDGELEIVFGGGETGFITYRKLVRVNKD